MEILLKYLLMNLGHFSNQILICWGTDDREGSLVLTITLSITYTTAYCLITTPKTCRTTASGSVGFVNGIYNKELSQFTVYQRDTDSKGFDYITIGY